MTSPQLQNAIEEVYAEFRVPKPGRIEGCPCCTDTKELCRLLTKPLRELGPDELSNYGARLFLTMGDTQDFQYFLPRLLEIAVSHDWWPSPEILLEKVKLGGWEKWPDRRRLAVERLVHVWFSEQVDAANGDGIDALLCGIGRAGLPLAPYLNMLGGRPNALKAFFEVNAYAYLKRRRLRNAFWVEAADDAQRVLQFLETPPIRKQLGFA